MRVRWEIPGRDEYSVIMATPAIRKNRIIVGSEDKYLYCYNATDGKTLWEFRTGGRVIGSAVVSPSKVLFGSRDGKVYILDIESGERIWDFDTGKPVSCSPAIYGDMFYILTEDGRLLAFEK
jgi:outer membrane protein assembly factor BamB